MPALIAGQNAALPSAEVAVRVTGAVDLTALVLSADGKVAGDQDMVFFNQPSAPGVALNGAELTLRLASLRTGAVKVVLVASPSDDGQTFGRLAGVGLAARAGELEVDFAAPPLTTQTALILCEIYAHNGAWKIRAVGQGYSSGLAGVAADFGISVDPDEAAAPPSGPAPPGRPRVTFTKGEDRLPPEDRQKLNLRKQIIADVLEKHSMLGLQARVILVLDVSGSTHRLYSAGVFARAVERVAPIAAQIDDGAEMQAWAMGSRAPRLADVIIGDLPQWIHKYGRKPYSRAGVSNNEVKAMTAVAQYVRENPLPIPTLVLFFHDGGVTDSRGVEKAVRDSVPESIFWQFIGLGRANYGILEQLDTLTGRAVDNTGFFAFDNIDKTSDSDLYNLLLSEFPSWMRSYYPPSHPALAALS